MTFKLRTKPFVAEDLAVVGTQESFEKTHPNPPHSPSILPLTTRSTQTWPLVWHEVPLVSEAALQRQSEELANIDKERLVPRSK